MRLYIQEEEEKQEELEGKDYGGDLRCSTSTMVGTCPLLYFIRSL